MPNPNQGGGQSDQKPDKSSDTDKRGGGSGSQQGGQGNEKPGQGGQGGQNR